MNMVIGDRKNVAISVDVIPIGKSHMAPSNHRDVGRGQDDNTIWRSNPYGPASQSWGLGSGVKGQGWVAGQLPSIQFAAFP